MWMAVMQKMLHCGPLSNLALTLQQFEHETGMKKADAMCNCRMQEQCSACTDLIMEL